MGFLNLKLNKATFASRGIGLPTVALNTEELTVRTGTDGLLKHFLSRASWFWEPLRKASTLATDIGYLSLK